MLLLQKFIISSKGGWAVGTGYLYYFWGEEDTILTKLVWPTEISFLLLPLMRTVQLINELLLFLLVNFDDGNVWFIAPLKNLKPFNRCRILFYFQSIKIIKLIKLKCIKRPDVMYVLLMLTIPISFSSFLECHYQCHPSFFPHLAFLHKHTVV